MSGHHTEPNKPEAEKEDLQTRYNALFELYAAHIHDHRLGAGSACSQCKDMVNAQIDERLAARGEKP